MIKYLLIILIGMIAAGCGTHDTAGSEAGNAAVILARILDSDSLPAANLQVDLYTDNADSVVDTRTTDSAGCVTFGGLAEGRYQIYAHATSHILLQMLSTAPEEIQTCQLAPQAYLRIPSDTRCADTSFHLSLLETPIQGIRGSAGTDGSIFFSGLPKGIFAASLSNGTLSVQPGDSISLVTGDTCTLSDTLLFLKVSSYSGSYLAIDAAGDTIAAGGTEGALLLKGNAPILIPFTSRGGTLAGNTVSALILKNERCYIGTDSGTALYNGASMIATDFHGTTYQYLPMADSLIYVCSGSDGLSTFKNGTYNTRLPDGTFALFMMPRCMFADSDSSLYIGTYCRGLQHWVRGSGITQDTGYIGWASLPVNRIEPEADGSIWLATSSGIQRKRPDLSWERYASSKEILSSCTDRAGRIWFGGSDGNLYRWNGSTFTTVHQFSSGINSLAKGPGNTIVGAMGDRIFELTSP